MRTLRVILGMSQPLFRDVLKHLLADPEAGMEVVGEAGDPLALLTSVQAARPDVVFLETADLSKPPGVCSHLLEEYPHLKIVLLCRDHYTVSERVIQTREHVETSIQSIRASVSEDPTE